MNKLARLINTLPANELVLIQKDLEEGTLQRIIQDKIYAQKQGKKTICPTCQAPIHTSSSYAFEFGPVGLRKKAYFDGLDCLEHFINSKLKKRL